MIELAIIIAIIIGVIAYKIFSSKEKKTITASVTIEQIQEVAKIVTFETFISDYIPICKLDKNNNEEKEIALLKIDCKIEITFDINKFKFNEITNENSIINEITYIPEPDIIAIENNVKSEKDLEKYKQTDFIQIEKGVSLNRQTINKIEKRYLEEYKKRPDIIIAVEKSKQNLIKDLNSFSKALGANFEIKFANNLKPVQENDIYKKIELNDENIKPFKYILEEEDEIEQTELARIRFQELLLMIYLIKEDGKTDETEKRYFKNEIELATISDIKKNELINLLENDNLNNEIIQLILFKPWKWNKNNREELPKPDYSELVLYPKISENLINNLIELAKIDNEIKASEVEFIKNVAKKLKIDIEIEEKFKDEKIIKDVGIAKITENATENIKTGIKKGGEIISDSVDKAKAFFKQEKNEEKEIIKKQNTPTSKQEKKSIIDKLNPFKK